MPILRTIRPSARFVAAAALAATFVLPGAASAEPSVVVNSNSGLTAPEGVVQVDGALWVADSVRGICKVDLAGQLVASAWCGSTELDHAGPGAPTGLAFDPVTSSFVASDGASSGGNIWRFAYAGGTLTDGQIIASVGADRITGLALGAPGAPLVPGGAPTEPDIFFVTKRLPNVQKLAPGAPQPVTAGFAQAPSAADVAVLDGRVYLAEGTSVTSFPLGDPGAIAEAVPGLSATMATSLAVDRARHRLYAGTAVPSFSDSVEVLDTQTQQAESYEAGFAGVTAMDVASDGTLFVADDPAVAAHAIDSAAQGRLFRVDLQKLHRPTVQFTAGPAAVTQDASPTFGFTSRSTAWFECHQDEPWWGCGSAGVGAATLSKLSEGLHRFSVRALDTVDGQANVAGVAVTRTFIVDRTAPKVRIAKPAGDFFSDDPVAIDFSADEDFVAFSCSVDDAAFQSCVPGDALPTPALGDHTLRIFGVDAAGNISDAAASNAAVRFRVVTRPEPPKPPVDTKPSGGSSTPSPAVGKAAKAVSKPALRSFRLTPSRMARPSIRRAVKPVRLTFDAPQNATFVRIGVSDARGKELLSRSAAVKPGAKNRIAIALSRSERKALKPGLYLVTAVLGAQPGVVGNAQAHWLRVLRSR